MEQNKSPVNGPIENSSLTKPTDEPVQMTAKDQKAPWYKNASILIAVLALLLSFGTTYFSYTRSKAQDVQNTKVELRGLLQGLSNLSKEYYEIRQKYPNQPGLIRTLQSSILDEYSILTTQADELARRLPRQEVSATAWSSIALAYEKDYGYELARELMGYAIESAKGFNEKTALLRENGHLLFEMGQSAAGRVEYQKALNIFSEFEGYDDDIRNQIHVQTCIAWAYAEADARFQNEADSCLTKAESYLSKLRPGPDAERWRKDLNEVRKDISSSGEIANQVIRTGHAMQSGKMSGPLPSIAARPAPQDRTAMARATRGDKIRKAVPQSISRKRHP